MKLGTLINELDKLDEDSEITVLDEEGNEYDFSGIVITNELRPKVALTFK